MLVTPGSDISKHLSLFSTLTLLSILNLDFFPLYFHYLILLLTCSLPFVNYVLLLICCIICLQFYNYLICYIYLSNNSFMFSELDNVDVFFRLGGPLRIALLTAVT